MQLLKLVASKLFGAATIVVAALALHTAASAQASTSVRSTGEAARSAAEWQATARRDVQAFADAARQNYIYAAYPIPADWGAAFDHTVAEVETKIPLVGDAAGYQAVVRHLGVTFRDAHVSTQFTMPPLATRWPGFLLRFDDGRYRVTSSQSSAVVDGDELTSCDDQPVSQWIETVARYEVATPVVLETTRMTSALRLLLDRGSPLRPRPMRCVIGDREVTLDWLAAPMDALQPEIASWQGGRTRRVETRMIAGDGAWVTLGYFEPETADEASAFHAAIAAAASLRAKRFIVLDVRGNGGGPYNWFMGYLRGLYGSGYADHYATARLRIQAVYRLSPAYLALNDEDVAEESALDTPADLRYEGKAVIDDAATAHAIAAGDAIFRAAPITVERGPPRQIRFEPRSMS